MATKKNSEHEMEAVVCMAEMKKDITYIKSDVKELKDTIKTFIECAPNRFANKQVEMRVETLEAQHRDFKVFIAKVTGGVVVLWTILSIFVVPTLKKMIGV